MTGDQRPSKTSRKLIERLDVDFAFQAAKLGIWVLDPLTRSVDWDDPCQQFFGVSDQDQLPYSELLLCIQAGDRQRVDQAIQGAMNPASGGQFDVTCRVSGVNNHGWRRVRLAGQCTFTHQGDPVSLAGIAQDVTPDNRTPARDERFKALADQIPAIIFMADTEANVMFWNQCWLAYTNQTREQALGRAWDGVIHPDDFDGLLQGYLTAITNRSTYSLEARVKGGNGQYRYFRFVGGPYYEADGRFTGIVGTGLDIHDRKLADQLLKASETRFRQAVEQAPVAILLVKGEDLVMETVNPAMLTLMERNIDCIGKPLETILPELSGQALLATCRQVYQSGEPYFGWQQPVLLMHNGQLQTHYFNVSYTPFFEDQRITGVLQVVNDVTDQIQAHQQLQLSEERYRFLSISLEEQVQERTEEIAAINEEIKATNEELEANIGEYAALNEELSEANGLLMRSNDNLQTFAYIASHDLQEPLRKIQQFGDLLRMRRAATSEEEGLYLDRIQSAASRMSTLIKDLLNYSRISTQRDTSDAVSLNDVVADVLSTLDLTIAEAGAQIRIEPLPSVLGDASQLEQLFQNLISNALKFSRVDRSGAPAVPRIDIRTDVLSAQALGTGVKPTRLAAEYYCIDITDNGVGFDEKYLDRIFQVFQRLHSRNEFDGTGIGLAICEKVVANHGGAIRASSKPGQGATFSIYLPKGMDDAG
ncbi:PAS domain-containing sensor histidine kinase [Spirosoma aerophilum]